MPKNHKSTTKHAENNNAGTSHRIKTIIVSILVGLFLIYDLSGIGGNIRFYTKWAVCGQKPVRQGLMIAGSIPHYEGSPTFSLLRLAPPLFCSPVDAERAGYSAIDGSYEFPHLEALGEEWPSLKGY